MLRSEKRTKKIAALGGNWEYSMLILFAEFIFSIFHRAIQRDDLPSS